MNEQIEKYLLPYLPYKLKYQKISSGYFAGYPDRVEIKEWHYNDIQDLFKKRYQVKSVKAILRPLSDLKDDLLDELNQKFFAGSLCINEEYSSLHFMYDLNNGLVKLPFWNSVQLYNWMLSKHLDVSGLIPKGLAIDINSLNQ